MISLLRKPDYVFGATENTEFRFEEKGINEIKYEYVVEGDCAKVIVYPSGAPVKYLKLRFQGDFSSVDKVYGDQWERVGQPSYLEWKSVRAGRVLPWFCYVIANGKTSCYGVKTGANCFAFFQVDTAGITLFLNLCNGLNGTDLQEPLIACEVVELLEKEGDCYHTAVEFSKRMCENPVLPKQPIFGVNNWYWAYGDISFESVLKETDYLLQMTKGCKNRPYMIIDDGWQKHRIPGAGNYIGGEWTPNDKFADMRKMADAIHEKGAKAGIWFRPLLTRESTPEEARLCEESGGTVMDPSHPFTLEKVYRDAKRLSAWGFDLIKHDFSTIDITGLPVLDSEKNDYMMVAKTRSFYDKTKTTATIMKNLYKAIQKGVGDKDVIGCNTVGHLTAGIHSVYRIGHDTSGRSFEWTRRDGINSVMRLPLNNAFYNADPDCAAFTKMVDADVNLDFLEMCALTGMTTLASVTPNILTDRELMRINEIFKLADSGDGDYGIADYEKNANPELFISKDGKTKKHFDWNRVYKGSRSVLAWME